VSEVLCRESVFLTAGEFAEIVAREAQFVVLPDHEGRSHERVHRWLGYVVVRLNGISDPIRSAVSTEPSSIPSQRPACRGHPLSFTARPPAVSRRSKLRQRYHAVFMVFGRGKAPAARTGGLSLGGILVIVGIVVAIAWSVLVGLIIAVVGLVAFGGFVRGRWY
jgi:hypothetical protein